MKEYIEIKKKAKEEGKKLSTYSGYDYVAKWYGANKFPKPENETILGWDVIKKSVEEKTIKLAGRGYDDAYAQFQAQISEWDKYQIEGIENEQQICMSAQTGFQLRSSSYLHWHDKSCSHGSININPIWENDFVTKLEVGQGKGSSYDLNDKLSYTISELGLFNGSDPNNCVEVLLKKFKEFRKREYYGNFLSGTCQEILRKNFNLILSGAPGTGKTWLAYDIASHLCHGKTYNELNETEKKQIGFVQFHPSYDYTDFVEGLRPDPKTTNNGNVGFNRQDGVFKNFCHVALQEPKKTKNQDPQNEGNKPKYVFIIDEINRGELSKIFGELFFCLDKGYRGDKHKVLTQYHNLVEKDKKASFKDGFYIPDNVYIIGTMNDIDRSVETMDFAMRRRFTFKEILASDRLVMLDDAITDSSIKEKAIKTLTVLNEQIEKTLKLSSAYHVGPAYFRDLREDVYNGDFDMLWSYNIKPLLQEYMRGKNGAADMIAKVHEKYNEASRLDIED